MQIPDWFSSKFFPTGSLRSDILTDTGKLKSIGDMEELARSPSHNILKSYKQVEDIFAVMREPVVARSLELPTLQDLVPDKYHIYQHLPPYYVQMWYDWQLSMKHIRPDYSVNDFLVDFITAYIIEFPWEQLRNGSRRNVKNNSNENMYLYDQTTFMDWVYQRDTLNAVLQFLNAFKLPGDASTVAKIFISRFLWYCNVMMVDRIVTLEDQSWMPRYSEREFITTCMLRDSTQEDLIPYGGWGGLLVAGMRIGRILCQEGRVYVKQRILKRLQILLLFFVISQPGECSKLVLEGLANFATTVQGYWLLEIISPVFKEVDAECLKSQTHIS